MSRAKNRFRHVSQYHRTTETLKVDDVGHGIYLGVNRVVALPFGEIDEQTTSIVMPKSEIPEFIEFLKMASASKT